MLVIEVDDCFYPAKHLDPAYGNDYFIFTRFNDRREDRDGPYYKRLIAFDYIVKPDFKFKKIKSSMQKLARNRELSQSCFKDFLGEICENSLLPHSEDL